MSIDTSSYYINPNTRSLTTNIKNTAVKDREAINFMFDEMRPVEDVMTALKTPINLAESTRISRTSNSVSLAAGTQIRINDGYVLTVKPQGVEVSHTEGYDPYDQKAYLKAEQMASSLDALLRNAGGTRDRIANTGEKQQWVTQGITDVLSYLGIDTGKDFYVNGMKYSTNSKGCFESEAAAEAQAAYERQKAANRTYEFADERTRKQIAYMSDYYLSTAPKEVKAAWQAVLEETGINPFPNGYYSALQQLAMEQDFMTGGNDNIFGNTLESSMDAVDRILDRIADPLGVVTEEKSAFAEQEKEFYQALKEKMELLS